MDQNNNDESKPEPQPTRRRFVNAIGAAAAGAAFLQHFARGQNGEVLYQDSFGNTVPANPELVAMGIFPPPIPQVVAPNAQQEAAHGRGQGLMSAHREARLEDSQTSTPKVNGWTSPNYLMIMVDQLRSQRWLPPGGQAAINNLLPNISALQSQSMSFTNYFPAATACTPSPSTLLTGLYTQQTCLFETQDSVPCQPSLNLGFPNIATVLSQATLGYECVWIGKWHLSDPTGAQTDKVPFDYGFNATSTGGPPSVFLRVARHRQTAAGILEM